MDTKDLILDAGELLFSENGVDGVSLRTLTRAAGVNLASVHYHFGSKEEVARAVFRRRIRLVNGERIELLNEIERTGSASVEEILAALFGPVLRLAQVPDQGPRFVRLCARFYTEPGQYLESTFKEEFSEVLARFQSALGRALPDLSPVELRRRMHFAIGVMVHTMLDSDRTRNWTAGACDPANMESTLQSMVGFAAAGFRADAPEGARSARTHETT